MDIAKLFGNESATKALLFIARYSEATSSEISEAFKIPKQMVYLQLRKLEDAGILVSRRIANLRLFSINPRSGIKTELVALLEKYTELNMPIESNRDFYNVRRRPRRTGKELKLTNG